MTDDTASEAARQKENNHGTAESTATDSAIRRFTTGLPAGI